MLIFVCVALPLSGTMRTSARLVSFTRRLQEKFEPNVSAHELNRYMANTPLFDRDEWESMSKEQQHEEARKKILAARGEVFDTRGSRGPKFNVFGTSSGSRDDPHRAMDAGDAQAASGDALADDADDVPVEPLDTGAQASTGPVEEAEVARRPKKKTQRPFAKEEGDAN